MAKYFEHNLIDDEISYYLDTTAWRSIIKSNFPLNHEDYEYFKKDILKSILYTKNYIWKYNSKIIIHDSNIFFEYIRTKYIELKNFKDGYYIFDKINEQDLFYFVLKNAVIKQSFINLDDIPSNCNNLLDYIFIKRI